MLSVAAARSIAARFDAVAGRRYSAASILKIGPKPFQTIGLSGRKLDCILELSESVRSGDLKFAALRSLPDDQVIERLTKVKGIGRWTAEMFLIFGLRRADVWSASDAGLNRAVRALYLERRGKTGGDATAIAERWRPFRSVASWYLWRHLD